LVFCYYRLFVYRCLTLFIPLNKILTRNDQPRQEYGHIRLVAECKTTDLWWEPQPNWLECAFCGWSPMVIGNDELDQLTKFNQDPEDHSNFKPSLSRWQGRRCHIYDVHSFHWNWSDRLRPVDLRTNNVKAVVSILMKWIIYSFGNNFFLRGKYDE